MANRNETGEFGAVVLRQFPSQGTTFNIGDKIGADVVTKWTVRNRNALVDIGLIELIKDQKPVKTTAKATKRKAPVSKPKLGDQDGGS
jgi:hypothetical protein